MKTKKYNNKSHEFIVDKHYLQFECDYAVYPKNNIGYSLCYCTDQQKAQIIADALTYYFKHNDLEKAVKKADKKIKNTKC